MRTSLCHIFIYFLHVFADVAAYTCVYRVCVRVCVSHRCAFFVSAYLSLDLRIHSVPQTELKHTHAYTFTRMNTAAAHARTHTSKLHVRGGHTILPTLMHRVNKKRALVSHVT